MPVIRAIVCLCLCLIASMSTAQDTNRGADYYLDRWREMTGDCGENQACCMRQARCLIDTYSMARRDASEGRTAGNLTASMNTMTVFNPVRAAVSEKLLASYCPPAIRQSARSILTLSSRFALDDTMSTSSEDAAEFFSGFETALGMLPDGMNTAYMDCSQPLDGMSFPPDVTDPVEVRLRRVEAAVLDEDGILAELYIADVDWETLGLDDRLRALSLRGEAEFLRGKDTAPAAFREAALQATDIGNRDAAYELQERVAQSYWALNQLEPGLEAYEFLEGLYAEDDHVIGQVATHLVRASALGRADAYGRAEAHIAEARAIAENAASPEAMAHVLLFIPRFEFDRNDVFAGCDGIDVAKAHLTENNLFAADDIAALEARVSCVDVQAFDRAATAFDASEASFEAGAYPRAIEEMEAVIVEAERPLVAEAIGAENLMSAYGSLAWGYVLIGKGIEAEEAARSGLRLFPGELWIEGNLAHALLLQGRVEAARDIYLKNVGTFPFEGEAWSVVMLKDFELMRQQGLGSEVLDEIEAELAEARR